MGWGFITRGRLCFATVNGDKGFAFNLFSQFSELCLSADWNDIRNVGHV